MREKDIFVFGRSIGCSVATYLAKHRDPSFVILMSPFKSLKDAAVAVVGSLLARMVADRLDNAEMIRDVTAPILIIHGKRDELIPFAQAQALFECCQRSRYTNLHLPEQMTHNRFNVEDDLVRPLIKFLHQARLDLASRTPAVSKREKSRSRVLRANNERPQFLRNRGGNKYLPDDNFGQIEQSLALPPQGDEPLEEIKRDLFQAKSKNQNLTLQV